MYFSPPVMNPPLQQLTSRKSRSNLGGFPKPLLSPGLSLSNNYGYGLPTSQFAELFRTCANHRTTKSHAAFKHNLLMPHSSPSMCTSVPPRGLTSAPCPTLLVSLATPYPYAFPAPLDLSHSVVHLLARHTYRPLTALIPTSTHHPVLFFPQNSHPSHSSSPTSLSSKCTQTQDGYFPFLHPAPVHFAKLSSLPQRRPLHHQISFHSFKVKFATTKTHLFACFRTSVVPLYIVTQVS